MELDWISIFKAFKLAETDRFACFSQEGKTHCTRIKSTEMVSKTLTDVTKVPIVQEKSNNFPLNFLVCHCANIS